MSSLAFTNRRQILSNQHPLRKQRSLIEGSGYFSGHQIINGCSNLNSNTFLERCAERSKNSFLKKQFSIDGGGYGGGGCGGGGTSATQKTRNSNISLMQQRQLNYNTRVAAINNKTINKNNNNNCNKNNKIINNNNNKTISSGQSNIEIGDNNVVGISVPWSKNLDSNNSSEISGFSSTSLKKIPIRCGGGRQHDLKKSFRNGVGDRSRKQSKGDDKININIFLSQTLKTNENDDASSNLESSSETDDNLLENDVIDSEQKINLPQEKNPKNLTKKCSVNQPASSNLQRKPQSAATRRAQFQANRENSTFNRINPGPISASPSLTIQRRAPLVRAMSAPVRSIDENTKNILANKRKSRRRKAIIGRNPSCDKTSPVTNKIIETSNYDRNDELAIENEDNKNESKTNNKVRGRSNLGCDVVTLVSLISSEGSDSEKEETNTEHKDNSPLRRPPFLRKTGKSVSFQENEQLNFHTVVKEFPHMLRRGSIAPLAARIRANRPPTAPPVSIFLSDYEQSNTKMSDRRKGCSKDDISIRKSSISGESKENNPLGNNDADNANCPDYVQSFKERECWKLFQKMSNKGVSVSYETVLRGMLTPTEFRNLQMQKDKEAAKLQEAEQKLN